MSMTTRQKMRIAQVLSRSVRTARRVIGASNDIVDVHRKGLNWRLDLREGIDLSIYLIGAFEWRTVQSYKRFIKPGDVVLDIGANIGAHTLHLANLVGTTGRVHAFEPTQYAYRKLLDNIALNPDLAPRIAPVQMMLTASDDAPLEAEICSSWPVEGEHQRHAQHEGTYQSTEGARAQTLDRFLNENGVTRVDFVKLDVDGHECEVLDGWTTIARYRPKIILELGPYDEHGRPIGELLDRLTVHGYGFYKLSPSTASNQLGQEPLQPAALAASLRPGTGVNFMAMPRS
jgi:FkbM family methyltransferase